MAMVGPRGLTSFTAAASVARQAQAGEVGAVLHTGPSVQAGVGDTATCKAHAAVLTAELGDSSAPSSARASSLQCPTAARSLSWLLRPPALGQVKDSGAL